MAADGGGIVRKRKAITGAKGGEAESRTPIEAPDSLISIAQARILDLISEGEIYGFVHGVDKNAMRDIFLDETPICNSDLSFNFKNVIIDSRLGTNTQSSLPGFPSVENEVGVNVELTAAAPFVRTINNIQLDALRVLISCNALSEQSSTTGDIDGYRVAYAIDIKADSGAYVNVISGAFDGKASEKYQRSHRIDLPPATTNWTLQIRRLTADTAAATIQDTTMVDSYTEIIDAKFRYPMSAICGVVVDASQFRSIPTRSYYIKGRIIQVPVNYNPITRVYTGTWDGTFKNAWTDNPAWIYYDMITNARYGLGHVVTASQIDKWSLYAIGVYCDGYVKTGDLKRAAATTTGANLSTSATDNSYNRASGSGSFITDGFAVGDEVIGTGFSTANNTRGIIKTLTALKMILDESHVLTTQGLASGRTISTQDPTEPRFTASIYFQRQEQAFKVIQDLASVFRGISYWAGGAIVPVCDMPTNTSYVYTNSNVVGGKFTYQGSGRRARHTVALVSWSDPSDFGRTKVEYVGDDAGIARYGVQKTQINAIGCTSQGTARRLGRWLLLSERLLTDTVSFDVGLDGTLAAPGQIIKVADAKRAGKRIGGRVSSSGTSFIIVDALPVPTPIAGDTVTMVKPDGTALTKTITSVTVGTRRINFSTVGAGNEPVVGSAWAVESSTLVAQEYRVVSVSESKTSETLSFAITAMQHDSAIFDAVENGLLIDRKPISLIAPPVQVPPTSLTLTATPRAGSVLAQTFLTASWRKAAGAVSYEVQWKGNRRNWSYPQKVTGLGTQYDQGFSGNWQFRVVAIGANKKRSVPVYSSVLAVLDQTLQPTSLQTATTSAATALAQANIANAQLAVIASDNQLSMGEKKAVITDYNSLINDQAGIDAEATGLGITTEKTNYDTALSALTTYLTGLSPAWNDQTQNTPIVGTTFRAKFADAYTKRQIVLNKIANVTKGRADAAQTTASTALTNANSAIADLSNIASDNVLSIVEKKRVINDWNVILNEKAGVTAQGTKYLLEADLDTYNTAYTALQTYLATLTTPVLWSNLTNITNVVGTTFRAKWADYYQAKVTLLQHIADIVMYGDDYSPGEILVANPSFTFNRMGLALNVYKAVNTALCDGWSVYPSSGGITQNAENGVMWNGTQIRCRIYGQTALTAGSSRLSAFWSPKIPVQPNKTYEMGYECSNAFNGTLGTNIEAKTRVNVHWYDATGANVGAWTTVFSSSDTGANRSSGIYKGRVQAPATASYMRVDWGAAVTNNSATSYTHSSGTVLLDAGFTNVWVRKLEDLQIPGSGYQIGDQRNLTPTRTGSTGSRWVNAGITFSFPSTGTLAAVTFNVAAGTLKAGSAAIAYNASSGVVNQTRSTTVTYYLYYLDSDYSGGAKTLNITTNAANISNDDDRIWIGDAVVTAPALGTGGSGSGGGGGSCVDGAMWIDTERQAQQICATDLIDIVDDRKPNGIVRMARRRVTRNEIRIAPTYRIKTEFGAELRAGETTPFTLKDGSSKLIADMMGEEVIVNCYGCLRWERIIECEHIGNRPVAHISVDNGCYFAGVNPDYRIASHNSLKP